MIRQLPTLLAFAALFAGGAAFSEELGDVEKGADAFGQCKACHQIGDGAENRIGPQLNGIFGRPAGSVEGVKYSRSMLRMGDDGLIWTYDTLDAYLENPKALVSKTRMNFRGLDDPQSAPICLHSSGPIQTTLRTFRKPNQRRQEQITIWTRRSSRFRAILNMANISPVNAPHATSPMVITMAFRG